MLREDCPQCYGGHGLQNRRRMWPDPSRPDPLNRPGDSRPQLQAGNGSRRDDGLSQRCACHLIRCYTRRACVLIASHACAARHPPCLVPEMQHQHASVPARSEVQITAVQLERHPPCSSDLHHLPAKMLFFHE